MKSWLNRLAILAGLGGILLLAAGAVVPRGNAPRSATGPSLVVVPNDQSVVRVSSGGARRIIYKATNQSEVQAVRLLGGQSSCNAMGCVNVYGMPLTIYPGQTAAFEVEYKGAQPGHFTLEVPIYTDCPGQGEIHLTIDAEVAEAKPASALAEDQ